MAKIEKTFIGDFEQFIKKIEDGILSGSRSATLKDSSDYFIGDVRCSVRVFERYSIADKSRTSMNVILLQRGNDEIYLTAITSGGGLSMFADNTDTWGEASFLEKLKEIL